MKRFVLAAATAVGASLVTLGGVASAAPTQAPRAHVITITCTTGTFEIAAPPGGLSMQSRSLNPGIIISGGQGVIIPVSATFTFPGFPPFTTTRAGGNPNVNEFCTGPLGGGATIAVTGFLVP
jgi:hypothetical protein